MKITEETKIKDLIPEDMELDKIRDSFYKELGDARDKHLLKIDIFLKNKQKKNFEWYYNEYCKLEFLVGSGVNYEVRDTKAVEFITLFYRQNYNNIPFEIKIGLLKFICDDLCIELLSYLDSIYGNAEIITVKQNKQIKQLSKICPKDFLNSIFE